MKNEIIYLDTEFIIDTYEKTTGKKAHATYTKSTNVKAGINLGAQVGASMRENFTYPIRAKEMYKKCKKEIKKYPTCETLENLGGDNCLNTFWINGIFGVSKSTHRSGDVITSEGYNFRLEQEECNCNQGLTFIVDNTYFTSGYNQLLNFAHISTGTFRIKAKVLTKILGKDLNGKYIATPLIVERTGI